MSQWQTDAHLCSRVFGARPHGSLHRLPGAPTVCLFCEPGQKDGHTALLPPNSSPEQQEPGPSLSVGVRTCPNRPEAWDPCPGSSGSLVGCLSHLRGLGLSEALDKLGGRGATAHSLMPARHQPLLCMTSPHELPPFIDTGPRTNMRTLLSRGFSR